MNIPIYSAVLLLLIGLTLRTEAFAPIANSRTSFVTNKLHPVVVRRDSEPSSRGTPISTNGRKSVADVSVMGLFGLGAPEIAIILVAGAFVLGPEKLVSLGKDAGSIAGELKDIPAEFQKGVEEGEVIAKKRARKTKKNLGTSEPVKDVEKVSD